MRTALRAASRTTPEPRARRDAAASAEAKAMVADLMALPPIIRRDIIAGLGERDLTVLLAATEAAMGSRFSLWQDDAEGFITGVLGEGLWSKPREIMQSIVENERTAVPSCFSSSKTWTVSRLILWWAAVHAVGTAKAVTIAPLWRQVIRQVWPEIRAAHHNAGLPGEADMAQLKMKNRSGLDVTTAYGIAANPHNEAAVQGIHCFDDQTELLTDQGWKKFPQVTGNERVLTLNGDTAEWGPITKVWRHSFKGELNVHDGSRVNFAITDNHRLLVRSRKKTYGRHSRLSAEDGALIKKRAAAGEARKDLAAAFGVSRTYIDQIIQGKRDGKLREGAAGAPLWRLVEYADLPKDFIVRRTNKWGGSSPDRMVLSTPQQPYRKAEHYDFDYTDWCRLIGWYVSEGSTGKRADGRGRWRVCISQKRNANDAKFTEITDLLDRMGIPHGVSPNGIRFSSDALGEWLREHCGVGSHNKRIPASVKDARTEHIEAFLDAYNSGDGHDHNKAGGRRFVTSSVQLRDDLHEVLCKLGRGRKYMAAHAKDSTAAAPRPDGTLRDFTRRIDTWHIHDAGVPTDSNVLRKNVQRVPYDGIVYCVSTPHETIMVRRKGCAMWSGNSPHLLLVVDEAGGIGHTIGRNLRALMTGSHTRMVAIGNPPTDDEGSWFEELCNSDLVNTIPIGVLSTPNFTGEEVPRCRSCPEEAPEHLLSEHLVDRAWYEETVTEYGEDSPYVIAKAHAKFPRGGSAKIIPSAWIDLAHELDEPEEDETLRLDQLDLPEERATWRVTPAAWVRLGVDVAADGGDELVIARCVGDLVTIEHTSMGETNANAVHVAGKILVEIRKAEALAKRLGSQAAVRVKIDSIGVGWGVASTLQAWADEQRHGAEIVPVNVSENTNREPDGSAMIPYRKRDELWIAGRQLVQPTSAGGEPAVRLRVDKKTRAQLAAPTFATTSSGHTTVESKKKLKGRGLNSPDRAEAVLLAVYEPAPPKTKRKKATLLTLGGESAR